MLARLVDGNVPKHEAGYSWGYKVRKATSLSKVLLECPYEGGYDLTIGTSERGKDIGDALQQPQDFQSVI